MDDRRRDGGTNFILRIKEQETRLTLREHDDDDDDDNDDLIWRPVMQDVHYIDLLLDEAVLFWVDSYVPENTPSLHYEGHSVNYVEMYN